MEGNFRNNDVSKYFQAKRRLAENSSSLSDEGLNRYQKFLGANFAEMEGKLVLDIGSGTYETFSKEAAKRGIEVVAMGPHLKHGWTGSWKTRELQKKFLADSGKEMPFAVAGRAQQMPFADNTFDYEVALSSVPFYLPYSKREYEVFFTEAIRILKPGGKAYFCPIFKNKTKGSIPSKFVYDILNQFSDFVTYKVEKLDSKDQDCRLVLTKMFTDEKTPE